MAMRLVVLAILLAVASVQADTSNHRYKPGESVELWVNKVGPYSNPQETYEYFTLPYCNPEKAAGGKWHRPKVQSLGERLSGYSLRNSGHNIVFPLPGDESSEEMMGESCMTSKLSEKEADALAKAVKHRWFYQMYVDDLPMWGVVGEMLSALSVPKQTKTTEKEDDLERLEHISDIVEDTTNYLTPFIYTSRTLILHHNEDQIVGVDFTSDPKSLKKVKVGGEYNITLFFQWRESKRMFDHRFNRYLDYGFFRHPIHWFSLFNASIMALFLSGLVALILFRALKSDLARYLGKNSNPEQGDKNQQQDEDKTKPLLPNADKKNNDDNGWKKVHGDVFRTPPHLPLFAALIGTGWQVIVLVFGVIVFATLHGEMYKERGEAVMAIVVGYVLSSVMSGYTSGRFFKLYCPTARTQTTTDSSTMMSWQATMVLTAVLLPTVVSVLLAVLNGMSVHYGTINPIPYVVIGKLLILWLFVSVPLCVVGTLLGRHSKLGCTCQFPCRVNETPRPIPEKIPPFAYPPLLMAASGLVGFGSIFIETYYLLTSIWNYKIFYVYSMLLGMYGIMWVVVGMSSIVVVYLCLNTENHQWQWTAFGSGASSGVYLFLYSIYYFWTKTNMFGWFQVTFYFGFMGLVSLVLGVVCGAMAHGAASTFVRCIFRNVKVLTVSA